MEAAPGMNLCLSRCSFVASESLETVEYSGFSAFYKACAVSLNPARLRSIWPFKQMKKKHLCVGENTHKPATQSFAQMAALRLICVFQSLNLSLWQEVDAAAVATAAKPIRSELRRG